jgi:uncharacterized protein (DUF1697 family)
MSAAARARPADAAPAGPWFAALLRGVNVGGRNPIRMPELVDGFRDAGYDDVSTVLQSGNVLFRADGVTASRLEADVEAMLERRFEAPLLVVVRSRDELARTIDAAPADHGSARLRSDVFFLKRPLTAEQALAEMPELREGVDAVAPGPGAIYFSRVAAHATKTRIQRFMALPVFQQMTVRTWRTVIRVLDKLDAASGASGADGR